MKDVRMDPERFAALLDAYGADPRRWPENERKPALEYLMASREARKLREDAAGLDALLDAAPAVEPTSALRERILAAAPAPRRTGQGRLAASALAASLLLGFFAGAILGPQPEVPETGDVLQLAQLGDTYQDF